MKTKVFKIIMMTLCFVLLMSLLGGCTSGCISAKPTEPVKTYEDKEIGDFVVRFYEDEDYCEIKGTTVQGNNKRFLVIPEYIDGVRVESLGVYYSFMIDPSKLLRPEIESNTIEKVYFEITVKVSSASFDSYLSCPNLKKVMYPGIEVNPYIINRGQVMVYYPRSMYENSWGTFDPFQTLPANVSYYYNYENAENNGYYWIDDCDYGEKIEFIPADPVRDGYTFGGWYKDAGCIEKWDFDLDILPTEVFETIQLSPEIITEDGHILPAEYAERTVYQETILYAKWICIFEN